MLLLTSLAVVVVINVALFFVAYRRQSDKLTDFAYALSFIVVAISTFILSPERSLLLLLVVGMVIIWGLRLGVFLVHRIRKTKKDTRFDAIRNDFFKFLKFWLGQAVVAWFLLLPVLFLAGHQASLGPIAYTGIGVWAVGLIVETVADLQKYRFTQDPANKGKWIDKGLWRYSRHPNYFGEIVVWAGVYVTVVSSLSLPEQVIGLASPLAIFIILRFVSGVPLLEKAADKKWGSLPAYKAYKRSTSLLVPLPKTS